MWMAICFLSCEIYCSEFPIINIQRHIFQRHLLWRLQTVMTALLECNVFLGAFHKPACCRERRWGVCGKSEKSSPIYARNLCPPSCTTYDSCRRAWLYHIGCLWFTWTRHVFWRSLWHLVDPTRGAECQAHPPQREMGSAFMQVQIQSRGTPRWHCPPQPAPRARGDLETLEEGSNTKCGAPVEPDLGQESRFLAWD